MSNPCLVWEKTSDVLSDDIRHYTRQQNPVLSLSSSIIRDKCLIEIKKLLNLNGKSLKDYSGMPVPNNVELMREENSYIQAELSYDVEEMTILHGHCYESLNVD
ncbi:hypothetical protein RIF29_15314 [Crotalaria pallida]|uniref:Uncharacterized protein n=1 Tax=Crotalaria pallida TaxID=3830 RepID=A0AAN9FLJ3_CROPI